MSKNDIKLGFGQYIGYKLSEIRTFDANYLNWIVQEAEGTDAQKIKRTVFAFMEECSEYQDTVKAIKKTEGQKPVRNVRSGNTGSSSRKKSGSRGKQRNAQLDAALPQ